MQLTVWCAAGIGEGACLGASAFVLRDTLPGFRPRRWVLATSLAAGVAWLLGCSPRPPWSAWPRVWVLVLGVLLGGAVRARIGTAQALVLPCGGGGAWVGWTALGWSAGLTAFTILATPLWHERQARWLTVLVGVGAGLVMAVTMSAVTGAGAVRLFRRARRLRRVKAALEPDRADALRVAGRSWPVLASIHRGTFWTLSQVTAAPRTWAHALLTHCSARAQGPR